jgi:hypothetical protein
MQAHKATKARTKRNGAGVREKGQRPAKTSRKKAQAASAGNSHPEADKLPGENKRKPAQQVKQECQQRVIDAMGEIVGGLLEKAKDGSCQHAKFLFDFAGVEAGGAEASAPGRKDESLAALLLSGLDSPATGFLPQQAQPWPLPGPPSPAESVGIGLEQSGEAAGLG